MTDRRSDILQAILDHRAEHGISPSIRELAEAVGGASTSVISYHLRGLERDGDIKLVRDAHGHVVSRGIVPAAALECAGGGTEGAEAA